MKKRPLIALMSFSFLLTGCSFQEVYGTAKDFFVDLYNKYIVKKESEESKEEKKEEVDLIPLFEANRHTLEANNYSYDLNFLDWMDVTFNRDLDKAAYVMTQNNYRSEGYAEEVEGAIYSYELVGEEWLYHRTIESLDSLSPLRLDINLEEALTGEEAEELTVSRKDNVYTLSPKEPYTEVQSLIEEFPEDAELIKAAYDSVGKRSSITIEIEDELMSKYDMDVITIYRSAKEGGTGYEYKAEEMMVKISYFDYGETVVERPAGVEVPPKIEE